MKIRNYAKKTRVGQNPIVTVGFGSRGQVDLVDMQSSEFGGMKLLLTYCDRGTKYAATCALPNKQVKPRLAHVISYFPIFCLNVVFGTQSATITKALFDIFISIGSPAILQPDNGREFSGIASKSIQLSEDDVVEVNSMFLWRLR
jgi:hypothetical protein